MIGKIISATLSMAGISGVLALLLVIAEKYLADYGICKITINDQEELSVKGGASLLATLNSEKIFLPSACGGRGTCAYCKCKVNAGVGPVLPTEAPMLTPEEIKDNIRLSCQIKVKQDMRITIPEELFNIKEFKAIVEEIRDLTHDIKRLRLRLVEPKEINFISGQYAQLHSKPYGDIKESVSRAYSIASPNSEKNYIDLMVRLVPDGICTTWVHFHLKEKEQVKFVGPMGDFRLHEGDGEIILIAGGSGMAPMVPLLEEIAAKQIQRKTTYFFGALTVKDLFYMDEMAEFERKLADFTYVPALSEPTPEDNWNGATGLITVPLENYLKDWDLSRAQGYLCGSPGMIDACIKVLKKYGITEDRIFFDPFA